MPKYQKKIVLITGAGRGLGNAIAEEFQKTGCRVIATDVDTSLSSSNEQADFYYRKLDVTSEEEARTCAEFVEKEFGRLDIIISNAGVFDFYPVSEAGAEMLNKILSVNVLGLVNLSKYFSPLLIKSGGRLIAVGSESFKVPAPFQPYAVSKQSLESVFDAIRIELSLKGIKCIMIRPGAMQTSILDKTISYNQKTTASLFENEFAEFLNTVPKYIGKVVSPHKVARLVVKASLAKRPKSRYHINHNPLIGLLSVLPSGIQSFFIKKSLQKKK